MTYSGERRRAILVANEAIHTAARDLFKRDSLDSWDILEADSFSRARFVQQHNPCDLLLVHEELFQREGGQGMSWLAWQRDMPVVFLAGTSPENLTRAYHFGASINVAWDMALAHPPLLATTLERAVQMGDVNVRFRQNKNQLHQSQKHVDRLVNLIWRLSPRHIENQWFSQRYMYERLQEELARAERHKIPLSLAIGEVDPGTAANDALLPEWMVDLIVKGKRKCDVAGQYGEKGFLLLMVHTPKEGGVQCCRRLQKVIAKTLESQRTPHDRFRTFFGVTSTTVDKNTPLALLRSAEQNLDVARIDKEQCLVAD